MKTEEATKLLSTIRDLYKFPNPVGVMEIAIKLHEIVAQQKKQIALLEEFKEIALEVTKNARDERCRYDHNRNCQEHYWFGLDGDDCPVEALRKSIAKCAEIDEKIKGVESV